MRPDQAIAKIQQLSHEMTQAAHRAQVATDRYTAHMTLYNAAAKMGDNKEMEVQRLAVHSQVDAIMDAGFELYSRQNQIQDVGRDVTH